MHLLHFRRLADSSSLAASDADVLAARLSLVAELPESAQLVRRCTSILIELD